MNESCIDGVSRRGVLGGIAAGLLIGPWGAGRVLARSGADDLVTDTGTVSGRCHPRFSRVRDEFVRNFSERGEIGASVTVIIDGETVLDLWGGTARADTGAPWEADTVTNV
jgi:CubicO group peptidase (beta-lactamase class C family)